ncbi:MAG: M1 family peptidase, partial [Bacteroidetes bacterium]|nr:M1 family peptidase [Bacteroidota bacterium]
MKKILTSILFLTSILILAQNNATYWQQQVDYKMDVDIDVKNYQYKGTQLLNYTNNSPDELTQVFYHLYFNAFQPESEMDMRLQNIVDPDHRMINNIGSNGNPKYESRIAKLKPDEIGSLNVTSLKKNGEILNYSVEGTILQVKLNTPIKSGESVSFEMTFEGQ